MVASRCERCFKPKNLSVGGRSQQMRRILEHISVISNQRAKKFPEAANPRGGGGLKLLPGAIGQMGFHIERGFERSLSPHARTVKGFPKQVNTFLNHKLTWKSSESGSHCQTDDRTEIDRHQLPVPLGERQFGELISSPKFYYGATAGASIVGSPSFDGPPPGGPAVGFSGMTGSFALPPHPEKQLSSATQRSTITGIRFIRDSFKEIVFTRTSGLLKPELPHRLMRHSIENGHSERTRIAQCDHSGSQPENYHY